MKRVCMPACWVGIALGSLTPGGCSSSNEGAGNDHEGGVDGTISSSSGPSSSSSSGVGGKSSSGSGSSTGSGSGSGSGVDSGSSGSDDGAADSTVVDSTSGTDADANTTLGDGWPDVGDSGSDVDGSWDAGPDAPLMPYACGSVSTYSALGAPGFPTLPDLNRDGLPDMAVVDTTYNTLGVYVSAGDGGFAPETTYPLASSPGKVVMTSDIDQDGWSDLITSGSSNTPVGVTATFSVYLNRGDGSGSMRPGITFPYGSVTTADGTWTGTDAIVFGDLNGDNRPDFAGTVGTDFCSCSNYLGGFSVRLNQTTDGGIAWGADNVFCNKTSIGAGGDDRNLALADFTGAGRRDVAYGEEWAGLVDVFRNQDGGFGLAAVMPVGTGPSGGSANPILVGDLNRDGSSDFVVNTAGYPHPTQGTLVFINKNDGSGTFLPPAFYVDIGPAALFDMNGDGSLDLVALGSTGVTVHLNQNDSLATFGSPIACPAAGFPLLAAGDMNLDGKGDLVVSANYPGGSIAIVYGQ